MSSSQVLQFATAHLLQLSVAIVIAAIVIRFTSRRLPHLAFLICMLALAKCIVPPLITSPAGLFTLHSGLSFSPQLNILESDAIVRLKQTLECATTASEQSTFFGLPFWGIMTLSTWAAGSTLLFCYAARKYQRVAKIVARCTPACRTFRESTDHLASQLGVKRRVRVMISPENYGPACVGFIRPTLILPQAMVTNWSDRLLTPVLAHELVHARRGDAAWGYVQFVAQIMCWFHPLVWWLGRHAQLLCERCCDEEVLSSLKISPADYGESLVRVLEMRAICRPLPVGSGMSPVEITQQRLFRLSNPTGARRTQRLTWCIAIISAAIILPGMRWASSPIYTAQLNLDAEEYRVQINAAILQCDWDRAVALLRPLVEKDPDNADALFFLGYALHANGQIDEAISYHKLAQTFDSVKPVATYNLACALAIKGQHEEALATLKGSIACGFTPKLNLTEDPDLQSLFRLPEFAVLNASVIMHRITPDLVDKIDSGAIRTLFHVPTKTTQPRGPTVQSVSHGSANGPITATCTDTPSMNKTRRSIDSRHFSSMLHNTIATVSFDPSDEDVRIAAKLRTPGTPTVDAELRLQPLANGCIEQTIECKIESAGLHFTRSRLIAPEALLPAGGAWQTM